MTAPGPRRIPVNEAEDSESEYYELKAAPENPTYSLEHDAKIIGWRVECFEARGFNALTASALAVRRDVDRAQVERLLDNGSSHDQTARILL